MTNKKDISQLKNTLTNTEMYANNMTTSKSVDGAYDGDVLSYRNLFNLNPTPMWVYDPETFSFIEVNKAAEIKYGYSKEEFMKSSMLKIRPKSEVARFLDQFKDGQLDERRQSEWIHQRKDGSLIDVEISSHPVDFNGKKAILVVAQDITRRKQAEVDLRIIEERYSAFVKQSSDAICLFELSYSPIDVNLSVNEQVDWLYENAVIAECNKTFAHSHGYDNPEEMQGLRIGQIFPRLAKENIAYLNAFIEGNYNVSQIETKELNKDGSITYFLNSLLGNVENGKLVRIWGAKQDISRIKKAEDEIRLLNKELEKRVSDRTNELLLAYKELESFSYSVSHDLRSPLRAISGFTSLLQANYSDKLDEKGLKFLDVVISNTQRMEELIADLLRLSRISKHELNITQVSMKNLFVSTFNELTVNNQKEKVKLTVAELPDALVDSSLMKIAISNLLSNAIKFSSNEEKPSIEVGYTNDNEGTYFVRDNGVGFNMTYATKLFNTFQRLHGSDEFEGTGVGLAIVQRIIQKHNGRIWADSELGNGATFYFSVSSI